MIATSTDEEMLRLSRGAKKKRRSNGIPLSLFPLYLTSITLLNKRVPVFFKSRWKRTAITEAMNDTTIPRTVVFLRPILKQTLVQNKQVQHLDLHVICENNSSQRLCLFQQPRSRGIPISNTRLAGNEVVFLILSGYRTQCTHQQHLSQLQEKNLAYITSHQ